MKPLFILYVTDQARSADFYRRVLGIEPTLNVEGMTEFTLDNGAMLGLMPDSGARRLLGDKLPDPSDRGGARCEVYLIVDDPAAYHARAIANGADELSPLAPRDWGDTVAYSLDPDGHVLAFASSAKA